MMLNETQTRQLLHEAGEQIPVRPESMRDLIVRGRRAARARRIAVVGAAVTAAALVVTGGLVLRLDAAGSEQHVNPTPAQAPQPPPGKRLVGMGRIAVAVPQHWGTNEVQCGTPMSDTVVFDSEAVRLCKVKPDQPVSSLHIVPTSSILAQPFVATARPAGEIDGIPIRRTSSAPTRPPGAPAVGGIVVESEGVVMWVTAPDMGVVNQILDSVMVLPEGYLTVPFTAGAPGARILAGIEDAGLRVRTVAERRPGMSAGSILRSDPPFGSVVAVGSTVTVHVSGGRPEPPQQPDVDITPCAKVPRIPADTEVDTVLQKAAGILEFSYLDAQRGRDVTFAIDYRSDPDCATRPDIRHLLQRVPGVELPEAPPTTPVDDDLLLTASDLPSAEPFDWETTHDKSIWRDAGELLNPCDSAQSPLSAPPSQLRTRVFQQIEQSGVPASETPVAVSTVRKYADSATAQEMLDSLRSAYESCARTEDRYGGVFEYRLGASDRNSIMVDNAYTDAQGGEFVVSFTVAAVSGDHLALVQYSVGHDFTPDMSIPDRLLDALRNRLPS
jgi:hypothetical protein